MLHLETWEPTDQQEIPREGHHVRFVTDGAVHAIRPRDPRKTLCGLRIPKRVTERESGEPTCAHCRAALNRRTAHNPTH